jgi:hypothetical protein
MTAKNATLQVAIPVEEWVKQQLATAPKRDHNWRVRTRIALGLPPIPAPRTAA